MLRIVLACLISVVLFSCATREHRSLPVDSDIELDHKGKIKDLDKVLDAAEGKASVNGRLILTTGREMISRKVIIVGGCWDFINAVYNRSNFPPSRRHVAFKSKVKGPYADHDIIEPGDWLYFINHSYSGRDHSGVFVDWVSREKKTAVIMSYVGRKKKVPGNYRIYHLENVYYVKRPSSN